LLRDQKEAYVEFVDEKKAFYIVWHNGLLLKPPKFEFPKYLWMIVHNWYHCIVVIGEPPASRAKNRPLR
jgi:hypothetical protein